MDKQKLWGILKVVLKIGFTAALLYLVSLKIDFRVVKELFLKSNILFIILAFVIYYISQVVSSWRSLSLLKAIGLHLKFGFNFRLYLLGMFYNLTLPGGVGGDGYKIYILRKKFKLPTKRIFLAILFDRMSGLWAIGMITVSLIIFIPKIDVPKAWPLTALVAGTIIYYVIMKRFFPDYSRKFFTVHAKAALVQSLQVVVVIMILLSQGFEGKFSPYLFSFLLATLAANIPISMMGLGTREYVMTHTTKYFGLDPNLAVFTTIAFFVVTTLAGLTGIWFVYSSKEFEAAPSSKDAHEYEEKADESISR